jgi:hypothetical protein
VKEPRHDDERLSALLAGRLTGPERDELLAHLSTSEEDADVAITAAAILREMEEEDAEAAAGGAQHASPPQRDVMPPSVQKRARGWPRKTPRWAGTLAIAGLVVLGFQTALGRGAPDPLRVAAALSETRQLPQDWKDPASSDVTRGAGEPGSLERGVHLMRLIVSVQARDTTQTAKIAQRLYSLVDNQASVLKEIEGRAGESPENLRPLLEQASDRVEALSERDYVRLGAWIEAARLAARRRDAAFFATRDTRAMLRRADRMTRGNDDAQQAIAAVRNASSAEGEPNWDALNGALGELYRNAGN